MLRALLCSVPVLALVAAGSLAADEKPDKKDDRNGFNGVVVKLDLKNHAVTVRTTDADGKEIDKTYTLGDDVRVTDESGKPAGLDVVEVGNNIVVVEKDGKVAELRRGARGRLFNADRFLERFDKNKDGFIQREELPERYRYAFDQIDTDKDGKLSREELEKGAIYLQRQRRPSDVINTLVEMSDCDEDCQKELQHVYDVLRKMDKNNNGKLDVEELKAGRDQIIADRVDEIIKDLDANGDGKISKEEARGRLLRDFDKLDLNKDGFIDREELLKAASEKPAAATPPEKEKEGSPAPKNPPDRAQDR